VKPPAPEIVRKGAVVRIASDGSETQAEAWSIAFLDLRFPDGHLERRLGPGSLKTISTAIEERAGVLAWATESADEHAMTVYGDLGRDFDLADATHPDHLLVEEIFFEWNAAGDWTS
jgi:hypothetical protein